MKQTVFFTSVKFYDQWTGTGGGGVNYPSFRVLDKARKEISFYFKWGTYSKSLVFDAATDTITRSDGGSFIYDGIKVGDTLTPIGTASNSGNKTVTAVTDTVISVSQSLTDEVVVCSVHGVTSVTYVNYLFNLIANASAADFYSIVDVASKCNYYKTGLDCTNVTPVSMVAQGRSQAWNNTETLTIQGGGAIVDYAQSFKIIHEYRVTPFWLAGQDTDFTNITPPTYFPMRDVSRVETAFDSNNPTPDHGDTYDVAGRIGWFNESERGASNYTKTSISCTNTDKDLNVSTTWSAVLSSAALFTAGTKVSIMFFHCPSSEAAYNYLTTNMAKNFMFDSKHLTVNTSGHGENNGTDYLVLTNITPVLTNSTTITVAFNINLATFLKDILKAKAATDRKFCIAITTQNQSIATTANSDRACTLFTFDTFGWNQDDTTGITLVDYMRCFQFPNRGTEPKNSFIMYPNEPGYVDVPFRVKKGDTLVSATMQIVATKSGLTDFVLEERSFATENIRSLASSQTIDMTDSRGYNTYTGDYYNEIYLKRRQGWDTDLYFGMIFHYGFTARFEDWLQALPLADAQGIDVAKSIENLTQYWYNFTQQGWALKVRWKASKKTSADIQTDYYAETSLEMADMGEISLPAGCEAVTRFYDTDDVEVNAVLQGEVTKIVTTFTGIITPPSGFTEPSAFLRVTLRDIDGGNFSKVCTPEWNAESTSPFSAEGIAAGAGATDSYASNEARLDVYGTTSVVMSTYYDDSIDQWSRRVNARGGSILIYPTLKWKGETTDCTMDYEITNIPILGEDNLAILVEDCP